MAKRAPDNEKPFRPLDASVLRSVVQHAPEIAGRPAWPVATGESNRTLRGEGTLAGVIPRASAAEQQQDRAAPATPMVPRLDQEKRILYTREETHAIDRLVNNLAVRLQAQVKTSHVLRALTALLLNAESDVDRRAGEHGVLIRPPNGDFAALQRFERALAHILADAIRDAGPLR